MSDFTPQGDINLRDTYELEGATKVTATEFYGDGSNLTGVSGNVSTSGTPIANDFARFSAGAVIAGLSYTETRSALNIEDGADVTDSTNVASAGAAMAGGAFHDGFSDFVANEHLDWTADQGAKNIHSGNYTDTNTQLSESDITTMGFTKDVEVDWTSSQSPAVIHADNYTDTNTTYVSSDFTHDSLSGVTANEHIDWTSDQGATNIDAGNYTDTGDTTAHASFSQLDYASAGHTGFAPALTGDQNYVTDDDITLLGNTSGANTGDNAVNSNYSGLVSNVTTNLSEGTNTETTVKVASSDGTDATMVSASTSRAGLLTKAKWDEIVANSNKISYNSTASTKLGTIEESAEVNNISDANATDLTDGGDTTLHDHDGISENTSARHTQNTDTALGSGAVAADHGTATTDQIVNVSYGTSATPPTASTTTEGSLYVQYTA